MRYKVNISDIENALISLGGEAKARDIQDQVLRAYCSGIVPENYKHDKSFRQTIQRKMEDHCPQAVGFNATKKAAKFTRTKRALYRYVAGSTPHYVDQFNIPDAHQPSQRSINGLAWERSRKVRDAALLRAQGCCEFCNKPGFKTATGGIYLETHHVIPLSEKGSDHESNVAALCPNDHREAHHGKRRNAIRAFLLEKLANAYSSRKH